MGKAVKYIPIIQQKFNINLMQQKLTFYQYQSLKNKQTNNTVKCIPIMQHKFNILPYNDLTNMTKRFNIIIGIRLTSVNIAI
jgi:hypothetical protein